MAKFNILVITLIIYCGSVSAEKSTGDFCKLNCRDKEHTMCKYKKSGPSSACTGVIRSGLNDKEKKQIVDLHNELRQKVASGKETRGKPGPQPAAKNMQTLIWDDELALIAQRWADQCNYDAGHDCSDVERFKTGQNLAEIETSENGTFLQELVEVWYDEVELFDARTVSSYEKGENADGEIIGHYTQFVWAETTKIGCGFVLYTRGEDFESYLVCNYGKMGNIIKQPVYLTK